MSSQKSYAWDHLAAPDALWRRTPTPFCARYYLLGVPLDFATNSPVLARLAEDVFGLWRNVEPREQLDPVRLTVILHEAEDSSVTNGPASLLCRARDGYYFVSAGTSFGFCDREHGFATAFLARDLLVNESLIKSAFLECLAKYMVSRHRPATLHAAGLVHNGRCALVTGPGGAGKSTLAYSWIRSGKKLLAEDIVHVELDSGRAFAWGDPTALHLMPDSDSFFPEVRELPRTSGTNGCWKYRVDLPHAFRNARCPYAPVDGVLLLGRRDGKSAKISSATAEEIRSALTGFANDPPLDANAIANAVGALLNGKFARLEAGSSFVSSIETIHRWMDA